MGKLKLTFWHNFNLHFAEQPIDKTDLLVKQGELPLLEIYEKHPRVKASLFISGYTAEYLAEKHPQVLEKILAGARRGQFSIGSYTYSHPLLSLLPFDDVKKQVTAGKEVLEKTLSIKTDSFLLPEFSWDFSLPLIFEELGIKWVGIYAEMIGLGETYTYPELVYMKGLNGTRAKAVVGKRDISYLYDELSAGKSASLLVEKISNTMLPNENSSQDRFLAIKADAEFLYTGGVGFFQSSNKDITFVDELPHIPCVEEVDRFLTEMEKLAEEGLVEFVLSDEIASREENILEVMVENISGHADMSAWQKGSEKINKMTSWARTKVMEAEHLLKVARLSGKIVPEETLEILERAWKALLCSETSDARAFNPHPSKKIYAAEKAIEAAKLSEEFAEKLFYG